MALAWAARTLSGGVWSRFAMEETTKRPNEQVGGLGPSSVTETRMAARSDASTGLARIGIGAPLESEPNRQGLIYTEDTP